jgi:hypothetical protein
MSDTRVNSLTERALLNSTVLDWINPSNCEKLRIQSVGDSALETLVESRRNPYTNELKNNNWHWGTKPVKCVARVLYTALVTCTLAPLGTVGYGTITLVSLGQYRWAVYKGENGAAEWEKTKQYAKAFFTDFTSTVLGAVCTGMLAGSFVYLLTPSMMASLFAESIANGVCSVLGGAGMVAGVFYIFGGFYHESAIPQFIAYEDERVGMYLALSLRNNLGLVNENGGLLKFSSKDKLEYTRIQAGYNQTSYRFQGAVNEQLSLLAMNAEMELLDKVREANHYLTSNGKKGLAFAYPFKGDVVAAHLEKTFPESKKPTEESASAIVAFDRGIPRFDRLIKELKTLEYKVKTLRVLHRSSKQLTLEDSFWLSFVKGMARTSSPTITIPAMKSYISEVYYRQTFEEPITVAATNEMGKALTGLSLPGIDEAQPLPQGATAYEVFKHRVCISKGCVEDGQTAKPALWLLGLNDDCTFDEYKKAMRACNLAVHPDKNPLREAEAQKLFQFLAVVKEILDEEFRR